MAGVCLEAGKWGGGGSFPRKAFQYGFQLGSAPVYLWRLWGAGGLHPPFRTDDGRLVCHVHGGRGERRFPFCRPVAAMGQVAQGEGAPAGILPDGIFGTERS